ncbi:MAG: tetratricopeptide repeat protein [Hyphomonadaceae bacterium]
MKLWVSLLMSAGLAACAGMPSAGSAKGRAYADFLIGRFANLREDHRAASDRYFTALAASPRDRNLLEGGARAALAAGDLGRARAIARNAGAQDIPAIRLLRAAIALQNGQSSAARAAMDEAGGAVDEQFAARFIHAWAKAGEGRAAEAAADTGLINTPRPFSSLFRYERALLLDFGGRTEDALTAYAQAEEEGLVLAPALLRHADLLVRAGQRPAAAALLQRFTGATQNPEIGAALARIEAGGAVVSHPLTPARGAAITFYGFGSLLVQETSDEDDGLVALWFGLLLDPDLDVARIAVAQAQRSIGNFTEARAALSTLPAASPYANNAQIMSAWILRDEGKEEEALAAAGAALRDGGARAQLALADLYRAFSRYGDAEPVYTQLIAGAPDDWRLYFSRGVCRHQLDQWPAAEADLRRALELSPEQPDILNYLGYSWIDRGEHLHEGLTMLQRAAELRPQSGAILDSVGWAYYKLGQYDQALRYLERAVELEPADAILNEHLGDGYWRVGRRLEARFQWRRVLTLDPTEEARAAVTNKLSSGLPNQPLANAGP